MKAQYFEGWIFCEKLTLLLIKLKKWPIIMMVKRLGRILHLVAINASMPINAVF